MTTVTQSPLFILSEDGATDLEAFQVSLPLPPKGAGSNARGSWKWTAPLIAQYRRECTERLLVANLPPLRSPITIDFDFYYCRGKTWTHEHLYKWRKRLKRWDFKYQVCQDDGNARESAKPAVDALQDAGIVTRDNRRQVRQRYCRLHGTAKEHMGRTELILTIEARRL